MPTKLQMPERKPTDGAVGVRRNYVEGDAANDETQRVDAAVLGETVMTLSRPHDEIESITLTAVTDGIERAMTVSPHNAWRLLGMLSMILDVPMTPAAGKAIKF